MITELSKISCSLLSVPLNQSFVTNMRIQNTQSKQWRTLCLPVLITSVELKGPHPVTSQLVCDRQMDTHTQEVSVLQDLFLVLCMHVCWFTNLDIHLCVASADIVCVVYAVGLAVSMYVLLQ